MLSCCLQFISNGTDPPASESTELEKTAPSMHQHVNEAEQAMVVPAPANSYNISYNIMLGGLCTQQQGKCNCKFDYMHPQPAF